MIDLLHSFVERARSFKKKKKGKREEEKKGNTHTHATKGRVLLFRIVVGSLILWRPCALFGCLFSVRRVFGCSLFGQAILVFSGVLFKRVRAKKSARGRGV